VITYDPKRWWRILLTFPRSPIFTTLLLDVVIVGLYAAFIVWIERDVIKVAVPLGPAILSLLGIILGLLLVFRTNTAYDRWWEGRKLWGQLVNVSRALARQVNAALPPAEQGRRALYTRVLTVFPGALAFHLRGSAVAETVSPGPLLSELAQAIYDDVGAGNLPREALISLTPLVAALDDVMGACERIRTTPIPFSYSTYIKWFVVAFALLIPFALASEFGYGTVVAAMFLFFSTMGIELLAGEVEEPFGTDSNDLPLEDIAATITRDVLTILGEG
jgi:putative membrane protein